MVASRVWIERTRDIMGRILTTASRPLSGHCLHTGGRSTMIIAPARPGSGVSFVREDLSSPVVIPAALHTAKPCPRRTILSSQGASVSTVEHLLAALWGMGIFDAEVRLQGAEVPILDGSAAPIVRSLLPISRRDPLPPATAWQVVRGFSLTQGPQACVLQPGNHLEITASVAFPHARVGEQHLRFVPASARHFLRHIAPARTFGFLGDASDLRRRGLARGATLGNVLVFDDQQGVLNPGGTRFVDEPVRHKILDALGDLALLGGPLKARVVLRRHSHSLLIRTLRRAVEGGALVRPA